MGRRDDSDELDDEPIRPRRKNTVLIVVACVGGVIVLGCGGGLVAMALMWASARPMPAQQQPGVPVKLEELPVRDVKPFDTVRYGDFVVKIDHPAITFGQFESGGTTPDCYTVFVTVTSTNPNRVLQIGALSDGARTTDDVGNTYAPLVFTQFGKPRPLRDQIQVGTTKDIRSDSPLFDKVLFDRPVPGARLVTTLLPTKQYGGNEVLRLVHAVKP